MYIYVVTNTLLIQLSRVEWWTVHGPLLECHPYSIIIYNIYKKLNNWEIDDVTVQPVDGYIMRYHRNKFVAQNTNSLLYRHSGFFYLKLVP